jgi:hypothetical protein
MIWLAEALIAVHHGNDLLDGGSVESVVRMKTIRQYALIQEYGQ